VLDAVEQVFHPSQAVLSDPCRRNSQEQHCNAAQKEPVPQQASMKQEQFCHDQHQREGIGDFLAPEGQDARSQGQKGQKADAPDRTPLDSSETCPDVSHDRAEVEECHHGGVTLDDIADRLSLDRMTDKDKCG